jgi:hypothetical protein
VVVLRWACRFGCRELVATVRSVLLCFGLQQQRASIVVDKFSWSYPYFTFACLGTVNKLAVVVAVQLFVVASSCPSSSCLPESAEQSVVAAKPSPFRLSSDGHRHRLLCCTTPKRNSGDAECGPQRGKLYLNPRIEQAIWCLIDEPVAYFHVFFFMSRKKKLIFWKLDEN